MVTSRAVAVFLLAASLAATGQTGGARGARPAHRESVPAPAEDISGMYSFLREGEFVQINLDQEGVTGYISRLGDRDSDRGVFLDQFFSKASLQGHNLAFITKPIHGVWFEFKGKFERGPVRTKSQDGYYVLRGTLTEFMTDTGKDATSRSREVEFKLLAQPADDDDKPLKPKR